MGRSPYLSFSQVVWGRVAYHVEEEGFFGNSFEENAQKICSGKYHRKYRARGDVWVWGGWVVVGMFSE